MNPLLTVTVWNKSNTALHVKYVGFRAKGLTGEEFGEHIAHGPLRYRHRELKYPRRYFAHRQQVSPRFEPYSATLPGKHEETWTTPRVGIFLTDDVTKRHAIQAVVRLSGGRKYKSKWIENWSMPRITAWFSEGDDGEPEDQGHQFVLAPDGAGGIKRVALVHPDGVVEVLPGNTIQVPGLTPEEISPPVIWEPSPDTEFSAFDIVDDDGNVMRTHYVIDGVALPSGWCEEDPIPPFVLMQLASKQAENANSDTPSAGQAVEVDPGVMAALRDQVDQAIDEHTRSIPRSDDEPNANERAE